MLLLHHAQVAPTVVSGRRPGAWFLWKWRRLVPWNGISIEDGAFDGPAPTLFPQTTGCLAIQLRRQDEFVSVAVRARPLQIPRRPLRFGHECGPSACARSLWRDRARCGNRRRCPLLLARSQI